MAQLWYWLKNFNVNPILLKIFMWSNNIVVLKTYMKTCDMHQFCSNALESYMYVVYGSVSIILLNSWADDQEPPWRGSHNHPWKHSSVVKLWVTPQMCPQSNHPPQTHYGSEQFQKWLLGIFHTNPFLDEIAGIMAIHNVQWGHHPGHSWQFLLPENETNSQDSIHPIHDKSSFLHLFCWVQLTTMCSLK